MAITDKERLEAAQEFIEYDNDTFDSDTLTDRESILLDAIIRERHKMEELRTAALEHYNSHEFTLACANDGVPPPCACSICRAVRNIKL